MAYGIRILVAAGLTLIMFVGSANSQSHFRNLKPGISAGYPIYSGMGDPLPGIANNPTDLTNFINGELNMKEIETLNPATNGSGPAGQLGPLFNNTSCASCHSTPAMGGGGLNLFEQRLSTGGPPIRIFAVDNMLMGGSMMQDSTLIFPDGVAAATLGGQIGLIGNSASTCQQVELARGFSYKLPICMPGTSNDTGLTGTPTCIAHREALPIYGDGLVEATADSTFEQIAANQNPSIRGSARMIVETNQNGAASSEVAASTLAALAIPHVGRFGWKAQHSSLLAFAADAYLNEIGITSDLNKDPNTTCAMGVTQFGVVLQSPDDPEDTVDSTGRSDVDRFTDFMRGLQPPPQAPQTSDSQAGHQLFEKLNCSGCHVESITTASNPSASIPPTINGTPLTSTTNAALAGVTYHPFSDFLMHDMGSMGDGVNDNGSSGDVGGPTMMRTMPLWGIRARDVFLHDGRATDIATAIKLHDGQGKAVAQAFQALNPAQQQQIVDFIETL
jgi:CxxC motif-containing protein (DUF1111 family)